MNKPPFKQPPKYWPPKPDLHLEPLPPWDLPAEPDMTREIARHEAAHAVANHLLDLPTVAVEVWHRRGSVDLEWTPHVLRRAVALLAAKAYERHHGLLQSKFNGDLERASNILEATYSGRDLEKAYKVVEESALAMAAVPEFHRLVNVLAPVLAEERVLSGRRVREILDEAQGKRPSRQAARHSIEQHSRLGPPSQAPVSTVSHADGTVSLWSDGRLIASRTTRTETDRLAREILGKVWG